MRCEVCLGAGGWIEALSNGCHGAVPITSKGQRSESSIEVRNVHFPPPWLVVEDCPGEQWPVLID